MFFVNVGGRLRGRPICTVAYLIAAVSCLQAASAQEPDRAAKIQQLLSADPNLRYVEESDKFFRPRYGRYTWDVAERDARHPDIDRLAGVSSKGLATINSAADNLAAQEIAQLRYTDLWINLSDRDQEGSWRQYENGTPGKTIWNGASSGTATSGSYTNWAPGEPNNYGGSQHGAKLYWWGEGKWDDDSSHVAISYLVEWDAAEVVGPKADDAPQALSTVKVPEPQNLAAFVKDRQKAILLGKALFWDMQVGSDGRTACATCHNVAGIDQRFVNSLNPGAPGSAFGPQLSGQAELNRQALARFRGANSTLTAEDFPFHKVADPLGDKDDNVVLRDILEVAGSQGVVRKDFVAIQEGNPIDVGSVVADSVFNINGANARQVTGRNSPTTINAIFFDRSFWDGRANHYFNGVNEFGDLDPNARVLKRVQSTETVYNWQWVQRKWWWFRWWSYERVATTRSVDKLEPTRILLNNAALASQAVGPPLSGVEMSWHSRDFKELGRKLLSLKPLGLQKVHPNDSVLGPYADPAGHGLRGTDYAALIRESFVDEWWSSTEATPAGYTQMEANFSLFWGLAIQLYEATLVSDQAPYDYFANGNTSALSDSARRGLRIFLNEGKCISCHGGPEFAGGTISDIRGDTPKLVERMVMGDGTEAWYDNGYYNIGVRPTLEDIAVGASHPEFGPLSYSKQRQAGRDIGQNVEVAGRIAVNGGFKTPTLRNIELTGPYFHNGGARTLEETVEFYVRGADFFHQNIADLDPDVDGISQLQGDRQGVADLVEFMKSLTDDRVRHQRAPFDHPELLLPNGHQGTTRQGVALDNVLVLPAVGRDGGDIVKPFEELVN
ncbi:cytochrome c peroxidase [Planctomycetaceae bacterium SH139]